jgi:hypothetical protein
MCLIILLYSWRLSIIAYLLLSACSWEYWDFRFKVLISGARRVDCNLSSLSINLPKYSILRRYLLQLFWNLTRAINAYLLLDIDIIINVGNSIIAFNGIGEEKSHCFRQEESILQLLNGVSCLRLFFIPLSMIILLSIVFN